MSVLHGSFLDLFSPFFPKPALLSTGLGTSPSRGANWPGTNSSQLPECQLCCAQQPSPQLLQGGSRTSLQAAPLGAGPGAGQVHCGLQASRLIHWPRCLHVCHTDGARRSLPVGTAYRVLRSEGWSPAASEGLPVLALGPSDPRDTQLLSSALFGPCLRNRPPGSASGARAFRRQAQGGRSVPPGSGIRTGASLRSGGAETQPQGRAAWVPTPRHTCSEPLILGRARGGRRSRRD